jgi:hypothetical protein
MTPLYGFAGVPEKPEDMTWQDWIRHWIEKHPPANARVAAMKVRQFIDGHYRKTDGAPIAPTAPHPLTGISWKWLTKVAMKGDLLGRMQPIIGVPPDQYAARERAYRKEIDEAAD